jgi:hypothetical protein
MTDSDWVPVPDYAIRYQAHPDGWVRNRNGVVMSPRPNGSGYNQLNLVDDQGETQTVTVHKLILRTFRGECPPGMEACHLNHNKLDNRLANLAWGPIPDNRRAPSPARPVRQPKTPAPCILCGAPVTKGGRRCHACVENLGVQAGEGMRKGESLEAVNDRLGYGNAVYLHKLAVRYGGWGHCQPCTCEQDAPRMPADLVEQFADPALTGTDYPPLLATLRDKLRRRFAKRGGDGQ